MRKLANKLLTQLVRPAGFPLLGLLLVIPAVIRSGRPSTEVIISGETWFDTDGNPIHAHGGGMLRAEGTYFWYGENHALGKGNRIGISCYSSRDFATWRNEGVVLPKAALPAEYRDNGNAERPKVLFNQATKKYVMWLHLDNSTYTAANAGVAVADRPCGPFTLIRVGRPIQYEHGYRARSRKAEKLLRQSELRNTFRDMNLFVDDDDRAYIFYSSEDNATTYVARLNRELTDVERPLNLGKNWARLFVGEYREAPAPFKHNKRYYVITSGQTDWLPNAAQLAVADSIFGPWKNLGNPAVGPNSEKTFHSQGTQVIPLPNGGANAFLYLGDRWNGRHLERSTYVWLPFHMNADGTTALQYWPGWSVDELPQLAEK